MPESYINKIAKIDDRLQLLNEERLTLLNERQELAVLNVKIRTLKYQITKPFMDI
ncbi:MAG: hypothetical protein ACJA2G_000004 [Cognaticolwellia sp.]|jgi:hypothetical protein